MLEDVSRVGTGSNMALQNAHWINKLHSEILSAASADRKALSCGCFGRRDY